MRTVFKKATRNSCPPKTREANQPIPRRKIFYGLGMVIQELIDFPLRRNQKSKVEAGDTEDLVGDEYPTCPTPPKKYITQHVGEHHQFQALLTTGTTTIAELDRLPNLHFGVKRFAFISGGVSKGADVSNGPPPFGNIPVGKKPKPATPVVPESWRDDGTALVMPMWHMPNRSTKVHDDGLKQPSKLRWEEV